MGVRSRNWDRQCGDVDDLAVKLSMLYLTEDRSALTTRAEFKVNAAAFPTNGLPRARGAVGCEWLAGDCNRRM